MLKGKTIVIGVSGGIAVYKICEVVSRLRKLNANVKVIMTKSAVEFVAPLTFQTLSNNEVYTEMFNKISDWNTEHISLAKEADIFLIAPATANIIGKIANGIADDMLTTTVMATKSPVIIAPAMNTNMYTNPIVQNNIEKLKQLGYIFIEPEEGILACGDKGVGRLAPPSDIVETLINNLVFKKDLKNKKILITAGPTMEEIDPVRYITNHSTGKMGYAVARASIARGADVTLISGTVTLEKPKGLKKYIQIQTALEMYDAVMKELDNNDIVIKTAAVADYRPIKKEEDKIKKKQDNLVLSLTKNHDILKAVGEKKGSKILVGFAAETTDILNNAKEKLKKKNLDFIVLNDLKKEGAGFGSDTNIVSIINKKGDITHYEKMDKINLANIILDMVKFKSSSLDDIN